MDTMELRIRNFGRFVLAGAVVALAGCSGGSTGSNDEATGGDGAYVPGVSSGSITYSVDETSIPVGSTSDFVVTVKGQDGNPSGSVSILCDSEDGVAILEPISGSELTNGSGSMSGVIGCEKPGSFRTACWGPALNRTANVFIKCTGDIPSGFTGFPNSAGGNLGGGVATPEDPAGGPGGSDVSALTIVSNVEITDVRDATTVSIDVGKSGCTGTEEELFGPDTVAFTIVNNSASRVTCSSWSMEVPDLWPSDVSLGDYESPEFGGAVVIDPNGGTGVLDGFLTETTSSGVARKFIAGSDISNAGLRLPVDPPAGVRAVKFTINCSANGKSFSKVVTKSYSFADYDYCE